MIVNRLRTEYLINPIGIDITKPRLMWNVAEGKRQSGFEIIANDDKGNELLNTGIIKSSSMYYDCKEIKVDYCTKVDWKIRVYDEKNNPSSWQSACFETGLKPNDKWEAKWISGNYKVDKKKRYPVDCFKKEFEVKDISKARLYITACGLYDVLINDVDICDSKLNPGITDYKKIIHYQTYDITKYLVNGKNKIELLLADGWYRGSCGAWALKNQYGTQTKIIAQLFIEHNDNSITKILTDNSWSWSNDGPIRFADNKDGEVIDARMIPSYNHQAIETNHYVIPSASNNVSIKEHENFKAKLIITPKGKKVLDFGQNIAGYISFKIKAKSGDNIYLRFGEMLDFDGEFTQVNIQVSNKKITTPLQEIKYICKDGINEYKTKFSIFGFQYALVESDIEFNPDDFTAYALYSDMEETGYFESSNELLNKFFKATIWSTKGNSADLPTDCPTRERHGWSGDAQIFSNTASYLFDYNTFAQKYLDDMYAWQKPNGCLPQIAPDGGVDFYMDFMNGSAGWADAGIIIPYTLYQKYQDKRILEKYLDGMRKYAKFIQNRCGKTSLISERIKLNKEDKRYINNVGQHYGEWAEPEDVHKMNWKEFASSKPEEATAYAAYMMDLMSEIEKILGNDIESNNYKDFGNKIRKSYQALMETNEYGLDTDRQARLVRPLYFDLLNDSQKEFAEKRLIKALDNYNWRLGTGFLSTPLILYVLEKLDKEYAYRLLENEELPGWLAMPKHGANTIWEAWEGNANSNVGLCSLNHYSKGAVCAWLFEEMCGIHIESENNFVIKPVPGGNFKSAMASYNSNFGLIKSGWEKTSNGYKYHVEIPSNCEAKIILPSGKEYINEAGIYEYEE